MSGLEQAIEAAVTSRLDQAVAAGKVTGQREQQILTELSTRLDTLVNRTFARAQLLNAENPLAAQLRRGCRSGDPRRLSAGIAWQPGG